MNFLKHLEKNTSALIYFKMGFQFTLIWGKTTDLCFSQMATGTLCLCRMSVHLNASMRDGECEQGNPT